jgi:hypothetical protein
LNKKLRAEELLKLSKLPPSMAMRENEKKKNEALEELDIVHAATATSTDKSQNVVFSPVSRKKKLKRKLRKTKSAIGPSRSQFAKSYIFDTKRDRDRGSIKVLKNVSSDQRFFKFCDNFSPKQPQQQQPENIVIRLTIKFLQFIP